GWRRPRNEDELDPLSFRFVDGKCAACGAETGGVTNEPMRDQHYMERSTRVGRWIDLLLLWAIAVYKATTIFIRDGAWRLRRRRCFSYGRSTLCSQDGRIQSCSRICILMH